MKSLSLAHWHLFFRSKGSRPAHFKELGMVDASPALTMKAMDRTAARDLFDNFM